MSWILKALAYATLLTWPGHLFAATYQSLLLALAGALTGRELASSAPVDLSASNLLTLFVSLVLASDFAPWPRRWRALAIGVPALVGLEVATGILGMGLTGGGGAHGAGRHTEFADQALELSRWLGVPLLWGGLLGRLALGSSRRAIPERTPMGS